MTERKVKLDRANKSILLRALGDVYYGQRTRGGSTEVTGRLILRVNDLPAGGKLTLSAAEYPFVLDLISNPVHSFTPLDWIPKIKYLCPNRKIRITGNNINTLATIAIPMSSCVILARNRDMGQRFWLFKNTSGCSIAFQASIKDKSNADRMPGIPSGRPILI